MDTGLDLERIVSTLQNVYFNYKTDLFTPIINRIQEMIGHSDDLTLRGLSAGKLIKTLAKIVGGGGKPTLANAGGKDPAHLPDALAPVKQLVAESLK